MSAPHPLETLLRELVAAERETQDLLRRQTRLLEGLVDNLPVLQRLAHDLEGTAPHRKRLERIKRGCREAAEQSWREEQKRKAAGAA